MGLIEEEKTHVKNAAVKRRDASSSQRLIVGVTNYISLDLASLILVLKSRNFVTFTDFIYQNFRLNIWKY